ncbi:hypothetical protein LPJ61_004785 [Coemansia biformis]|uniref:Uncharacterized protein n=1 Tax=Coemansia biformis TaxID=1286918 RepID=A0A9W7YA05_9FUNG|nr:hypothetical protein LPJ61_004785 [Coemansia biformis]
MEVRRPARGKARPREEPDPDQAAWEERLTKRFKHSPDWIEDEKAVVAKALRSGRKSVAEIARRLGGSKSLRQVAEYLERLELWSRVLGTPEQGGSQPREAKEVIGWFVLEEDKGAAASAQREDEEVTAANEAFEGHLARYTNISMRYKRYDAIIDAECTSLLAKVTSHSDKAAAARKLSAFVAQALDEFLRKVIHELLISGKLASTEYGHLKTRGWLIADEDVEVALERCGLPPTQHTTKTFERLLRRHLADDVFHKLCPRASPSPSPPSATTEPHTAADADSEIEKNGSGAASDTSASDETPGDETSSDETTSNETSSNETSSNEASSSGSPDNEPSGTGQTTAVSSGATCSRSRGHMA